MGNYPRNDVNSNTAKVWPGSQDNPGEWQSGPGADPDIPLEGTSIRKATEISVARKLQDRQAQKMQHEIVDYQKLGFYC